MDLKLEKILSHYDLGGTVISCEQFGEGHINWTYRVETANGDLFVLQKINTFAFRNPVGLMRNIELLTDFMRKKAEDPRQVLHLVKTKENRTYIVTEDDEYWRIYDFVRGCVCYDSAPEPRFFRECGRGFGQFQAWLFDFPVNELVETIPNFHNTVSRFADFEKALAADVKDRAKTAQPEIEYLLSQKPMAPFLLDKVAHGEIPLRVTHNDTKINNVMFDKYTDKAVCVLDLDTTMPGIPAMDFGDAIRYAANNGAEDERDLDKVYLRVDLFEAFAEGFCGICRDNLNREELIICPEASKLVTTEIGMRFLADYLEGDVYFQTAYPEHNLVRARTQFKLAADMDRHMDEMKNIVYRILK